MNRAEHRERALSLLDDVAKTTVGSPARASWLAEAQVHATLALSADGGIVLPDGTDGTGIAEGIVGTVRVGLVVDQEPEQKDEPRPTPPPKPRRSTRKSPTTDSPKEPQK